MSADSEESLVSQCLEFSKMLADMSMPFSFSLTVGTKFSFSVEARGKEALPSAKKRKTPSTLRRNAKRREEFLKKKLASTTEKSQEVSEKEAKSPGKAPTVLHVHPSPSPSSERRKVFTVGRKKEVLTFSQLDGATTSDLPAARKEMMTSRCEFCSKLEWEIGCLVMPQMCQGSKVTCPHCQVKATEVGACMDCVRGFNHNTGKKIEGFPNLKCRSCQ